MAYWYAQSSNGNISDANKWGNTPTSPTAYLFDGVTGSFAQNIAVGDILQLNGKTGINIDVSFICARISSTVENSVGTASGNLVISSGSVTLGASGNRTTIKSGGSNVLVVSGGTLTIYGDVYGSSTTTGCVGITLSGNTTSLTIYGFISGGTGTSYGISRSGNGILLITASVSVQAPSSAYGLNDTGGGTITLTGDVVSDGGTWAIYCLGNSAVMLITGNVSGYMGGGINYMGSGSLEIIGNVTGCGFFMGSMAGVQSSNSGLVTIRGNVTGGANTNCFGFLCNSTVSPVIYGNVLAGMYCSGISTGTTAQPIKVQGNLIDSLNFAAYSGKVRFNPPANAYHQVYDWSGNAIKLPLQLTAPVVKKGTTHGEVIGTLPPASPFRRINRFV